MHATAAETNNFLIPNGTFLVELIIFAIVLIVLGWYVGPAVAKALRDREEMVEKTIAESQEANAKLTAAEQRQELSAKQVADAKLAAERLAEAERKYSDALTEARTEAAKIRDAACADAERIVVEMREQADREVTRIKQRAEEDLVTQRQQ